MDVDGVLRAQKGEQGIPGTRKWMRLGRPGGHSPNLGLMGGGPGMGGQPKLVTLELWARGVPLCPFPSHSFKTCYFPPSSSGQRPWAGAGVGEGPSIKAGGRG